MTREIDDRGRGGRCDAGDRERMMERAGRER
jgi:hypothetical protein